MNAAPAIYCGDSVYATALPRALLLTTDHHEETQAGNVIILEPEVIQALLRYIQRHNPELLSTL